MFRFYIILFITMIFYGCCNEDDSSELRCEFKDLKITANARTFENLSWRWSKSGNTLIINAESEEDECEEISRIIEFNISQCPTILKSSVYRCGCDTECINPTQNLTTDLEFQEWNLNSKIVGKNGDTLFWVDLTEENRIN